MTIAHCLDTNILLYTVSRDPREAAKARIAGEWFRRPDWGSTVQVLQEFYANAVREKRGPGRDSALAVIEEIASSRPIVAVDLALMRHAFQICERFRIGYWDAAVVAGARRLGATVLVTEDLSHGQDYGGVRVLNPFLAR